jgi:hypothetical protein
LLRQALHDVANCLHSSVRVSLLLPLQLKLQGSSALRLLACLLLRRSQLRLQPDQLQGMAPVCKLPGNSAGSYSIALHCWSLVVKDAMHTA